ncbi:hypothetical protein [Sphingobium lignivorans]|uniref:Uncharacterized protein n=1 Tax=Sphingobium lignivorans TaxID=2735886 RepID=A0ABR6NIB9_9SPHN|nr:hypothetical protein [Sphingobium lignivorans]MBB5985929.1 hypothetical protein [Sphingobium lignivorans]
MASRAQIAMRRMRRDAHSQWAVPALYIAFAGAEPRDVTVRLWLKSDNNMVGALQGMSSAEMAEPSDRIRFDLKEISAVRRNAIVSVEDGEAYRIDFQYPPYRGFQTARVTRLSTEEAEGLPVPE